MRQSTWMAVTHRTRASSAAPRLHRGSSLVSIFPHLMCVIRQCEELSGERLSLLYEGEQQQQPQHAGPPHVGRRVYTLEADSLPVTAKHRRTLACTQQTAVHAHQHALVQHWQTKTRRQGAGQTEAASVAGRHVWLSSANRSLCRAERARSTAALNSSGSGTHKRQLRECVCVMRPCHGMRMSAVFPHPISAVSWPRCAVLVAPTHGTSAAWRQTGSGSPPAARARTVSQAQRRPAAIVCNSQETQRAREGDRPCGGRSGEWRHDTRLTSMLLYCWHSSDLTACVALIGVKRLVSSACLRSPPASLPRTVC